jgi:hypothetical protein
MAREIGVSEMSLELLGFGLLIASLLCFLTATMIGWLLALDSLTRAYQAVTVASQEANHLAQLAQLQNNDYLLVQAQALVFAVRRIARAIVQQEGRW